MSPHTDAGALLKLADEIDRACKAPTYEVRLGTIEGKMVVAALRQAASQDSAGGEANSQFQSIPIDGPELGQAAKAAVQHVQDWEDRSAANILSDQQLLNIYVEDQGCSHAIATPHFGFDMAVCGLEVDGDTCACLAMIRKLRAALSPPVKTGCGDPSCRDPNCTYGQGPNLDPISDPVKTGGEAETTCCKGLAPTWECRCEIERKAAGHPPYQRSEGAAQGCAKCGGVNCRDCGKPIDVAYILQHPRSCIVCDPEFGDPRDSRRPAQAVPDTVQDTYLVGGPPDLKAMSGSVESDRVIQLHFRRRATDADRKWLLEAINAKIAADGVAIPSASRGTEA